jgi:hypothetical protein
MSPVQNVNEVACPDHNCRATEPSRSMITPASSKHSYIVSIEGTVVRRDAIVAIVAVLSRVYAPPTQHLPALRMRSRTSRGSTSNNNLPAPLRGRLPVRWPSSFCFDDPAGSASMIASMGFQGFQRLPACDPAFLGQR